MSRVRTITVAAGDDDIRLDRWFKRHFPTVGHGSLEKLLRTGQIRVDGGRIKASIRIAAGQEIRVPPMVVETPVSAPQLRGSDQSYLRGLVIHRDHDMIAIDKPAGLAVQGGMKVGVSVDSLLEALQFDAPERPRLVHRLDKATSGVLLLARSRKAASGLITAFRDGAIVKEYWALVNGVPEHEHGLIDLALAKKSINATGYEKMVGDLDDGKPARTTFRVIDQAAPVISWLSLVPQTGRTHQLRVHCRTLGHPILGDTKYGVHAPVSDGRLPVRRLMLHARQVRVPRAHGKFVTVTAGLDADLRAQWAFYGFDADFVRDIESFTADRSF